MSEKCNAEYPHKTDLAIRVLCNVDKGHEGGHVFFHPHGVIMWTDEAPPPLGVSVAETIDTAEKN
jgi:hypothetical protein